MVFSWVRKGKMRIGLLLYVFFFFTIWKERNSSTFNNEGRSIQGLKFSFICDLWAWWKLYIVPNTLSFVDLVE